jgi:RNA polymerase sigma factor (TIGR02999 family)
MRWERAGCSLQSTILVHDAFMALARQRNLQASDRSSLLAAAAQTMRRLLIDNARAGQRQKRGGNDFIVSLPPSLADDARRIDERELHDALNALKEHCETTARIVEMRFFSGMTHAEIALVTGLSERTIGEKWRFAKVWLYRAMNPDG